MKILGREKGGNASKPIKKLKRADGKDCYMPEEPTDDRNTKRHRQRLFSEYIQNFRDTVHITPGIDWS